jgi:hypothetical protein
MPESFEIRFFKRRDVAECASALVPTYTEPPYNERISADRARSLLAHAMDQEPKGCWVAVADGRIIGGLLASSNSEDGTSLTISELFVVPE